MRGRETFGIYEHPIHLTCVDCGYSEKVDRRGRYQAFYDGGHCGWVNTAKSDCERARMLCRDCAKSKGITRGYKRPEVVLKKPPTRKYKCSKCTNACWLNGIEAYQMLYHGGLNGWINIAKEKWTVKEVVMCPSCAKAAGIEKGLGEPFIPGMEAWV